MNQLPTDHKRPAGSARRNQLIQLGLVIADTTWRMFVPIIGLTVLGVWGDRSFGTKPWLTACGIVVGVVIAGWLIKGQLKQGNR